MTGGLERRPWGDGRARCRRSRRLRRRGRVRRRRPVLRSAGAGLWPPPLPDPPASMLRRTGTATGWVTVTTARRSVEGLRRRRRVRGPRVARSPAPSVAVAVRHPRGARRPSTPTTSRRPRCRASSPRRTGSRRSSRRRRARRRSAGTRPARRTRAGTAGRTAGRRARSGGGRSRCAVQRDAVRGRVAAGVDHQSGVRLAGCAAHAGAPPTTAGASTGESAASTTAAPRTTLLSPHSAGSLARRQHAGTAGVPFFTVPGAIGSGFSSTAGIAAMVAPTSGSPSVSPLQLYAHAPHSVCCSARSAASPPDGDVHAGRRVCLQHQRGRVRVGRDERPAVAPAALVGVAQRVEERERARAPPVCPVATSAMTT